MSPASSSTIPSRSASAAALRRGSSPTTAAGSRRASLTSSTAASAVPSAADAVASGSGSVATALGSARSRRSLASASAATRSNTAPPGSLGALARPSAAARRRVNTSDKPAPLSALSLARLSGFTVSAACATTAAPASRSTTTPPRRSSVTARSIWRSARVSSTRSVAGLRFSTGPLRSDTGSSPFPVVPSARRRRIAAAARGEPETIGSEGISQQQQPSEAQPASHHRPDRRRQRHQHRNDHADAYPLAALARRQRRRERRPQPAGDNKDITHRPDGQHPRAGLSGAITQGREGEDEERVDLHVEARAKPAGEAAAPRRPAIDPVERERRRAGGRQDPAPGLADAQSLGEDADQQRRIGGAQQRHPVGGPEAPVRRVLAETGEHHSRDGAVGDKRRGEAVPAQPGQRHQRPYNQGEHAAEQRQLPSSIDQQGPRRQRFQGPQWAARPGAALVAGPAVDPAVCAAPTMTGNRSPHKLQPGIARHPRGELKGQAARLNMGIGHAKRQPARRHDSGRPDC